MSAAAEYPADIRYAATLCELRRYPEAASVLSRVLATQAESFDAWCYMATAQLGLENAEAALRAAETAIALRPESEWPHRLSCGALRRLGRFDEALAQAREAVRLDPENWAAHTNLARSLLKVATSAGEARAAAEQAVALGPDQAETNLVAGAVAAHEGRREAAETAFRQALAIDPQCTAAHSELARMRMRAGSLANVDGLAEAATGFATALRVDPSVQRVRHNLDLVLRVFLKRVSYLVFVDAWLIARLGSSSSQPLARLLPIVLLAAPAVLAWRFVVRLDANLRSYVARLLRDRGPIRFAVALDAIAILSLLAAAAPAETMRAGLIGTGTVAALVAYCVLLTQTERVSRTARGLPNRPLLGTPMLWLLAALLLTFGVLMFVESSRPTFATGGLVLGVIGTAGSALVVVQIRRRSAR